MAAPRTIRVTDEDDSVVDLTKVDAEDWPRLVVSVTDENDIPITCYLDIPNAAKVHSFLGAWLKEQN